MTEIISTQERKIETVFKAVEPLVAVKEGHGYRGVLLRDVINDLLQCHICGKWRKGLATHIWQAHSMKADDYRDEYELPISCPLVSISTSSKHSIRATSERNLAVLAKHRNPYKALSERRKIGNKLWKRVYNLSHENKHGLCAEQINRRFMVVSDIVGREPSQKDLEKYDPNLWSGIRRRYKTLNIYREKNNFTIIKRFPLFDSDKLISSLRKFAIDHKRIPSSNDFRNGSPNVVTFRNHFGSFNRAMILAGFQHELKKSPQPKEESIRIKLTHDKVMGLTHEGFTANEISNLTKFPIKKIHDIRKKYLPEKESVIELEDKFSI